MREARKTKCCEPKRDSNHRIVGVCVSDVVVMLKTKIGRNVRKYPLCAEHLSWYKEKGELDDVILDPKVVFIGNSDKT